ncbi:MAG: hypothetical protein ACI9N1_001045 [Flavobacteriales bacterium]|jgi:hypothetical protein
MKIFKRITIVVLSLFILGISVNAQAKKRPLIGIGITAGIVAGMYIYKKKVKVQEANEKADNSIENKELTDVKIFSNGEELKTVQLGQSYDIEIHAKDKDGKTYVSGKNGNTPWSDWLMDVKGAYGTGTIRVDKSTSEMVDNKLKITLTSKYNSEITYPILIPLPTPTSLEILVDNERSSIMPSGNLYFSVAVKYDDSQFDETIGLSAALSRFEVGLTGAESKGDFLRITSLPYGKSKNDQVMITLADKQNKELKVSKNLALSYSGTRKVSFSAKSGGFGQDGEAPSNSPGGSGGMGNAGSTAQPIEVYVDTYTGISGLTLIAVKIKESDGSECKYLLDSKTGSLVIYNNGGQGGQGGRGGNGSSDKSSGSSRNDIGYSGGNGGNGGQGGTGGKITMYISPEAQKLNPKIELLNSGGNGGSGGGGGFGGSYEVMVSENSFSTKTASSGPSGPSGNRGASGPKPVIKVQKVNIKL